MKPRLHSIQRDETRSVALLFLYGFGNAASYVLAKTVADSTFLTHFGYYRLPELYMLSAGVVALTSVVYGDRLRRYGLHRTVHWTLAMFAVSSLALPWLMLRYEASLTIFALAYLQAQVRGSLGTIQYATVFNEQFGSREPERIVGIVGFGATLAGISMGLLIALVSKSFPVEWLLYLAACIDLATMLPLRLLKDAGRSSASRDEPLPSVRSRQSHGNDSSDVADILLSPSYPQSVRFRDLRHSRYIMLIALTVTLCIIATTFVEYQWKVTATDEFHHDTGGLARYFGFFYGALYLVTGIMQLFITSRVLQFRGSLLGLVAFPIALFLFSLLAWLAAAEHFLLWMLTLCKGTDILRRGLYDPALQVLYSPLTKRLRRQAIAFVAGIAKPFAEAVAGVAMVVMTQWMTPQQLSPFVLAVLVVWLVLSGPLYRRFQSLRGPTNAKPSPDYSPRPSIRSQGSTDL